MRLVSRRPLLSAYNICRKQQQQQQQKVFLTQGHQRNINKLFPTAEETIEPVTNGQKMYVFFHFLF
jgi:hypothetical protein